MATRRVRTLSSKILRPRHERVLNALKILRGERFTFDWDG
jgi:hypothetical protein